MSRTIRTLGFAGLLALLLVGCGDSTDVKVSIEPPTAMVVAGQTKQFTGTQTVTTPNSIDIKDDASQFDWTVVEAGGGTIAPDTFFSSSYVYTAPLGPGTFHVKITSKMDSSATAEATVTVVSP